MTEFMCGNNVCERVGYVACIRSPLDTTGMEAFCMKCTDTISKCATTMERGDCNLFCQELVRNRTMVEAIKEQTLINATFTETIQDMEEALSNTWNLHLVLWVLVAVLVAGLLFALVVVLCRKRYKIHRDKDPEKADNDSHTEGEEPNDEDETSKMIGASLSLERTSSGCKTNSEDSQMKETASGRDDPDERISVGCQTNSEDNQMREMASGRDDPDERTSTGCQTNCEDNQIREMETCRDDPDGCQDATKSCQVHTQPSDDDDHPVIVDIAASKPVGLSQCRGIEQATIVPPVLVSC